MSACRQWVRGTAWHNIESLNLRLKRPASEPLVTVVVPLYNEQRFLAECLRSVGGQTHRNLECLIVDDCSTDDSPRIAASFASDDPRFRVVRHDKNRGLSASRNTGLETAAGRYVIFLDADDYLYAGTIQRRVRAIEREPSPDIAGAYSRTVQVPEASPSSWGRIAPHLPAFAPDVDFITAAGECPFNVHAVMLETEVVRRFEGFDEGLVHGAEDWELWLRVLRNGFRFSFARDYGAAYRQKGGSMVRRMPMEHVDVSMGLISNAFAKLDKAHVVAGAPYVFDQPLPHYQAAIKRARRLISYAALAYLSKGPDAAGEILDRLDRPVPLFLTRHVDLGHTVREAITRFYFQASPAALPSRGESERTIVELVTQRCAWPREQRAA